MEALYLVSSIPTELTIGRDDNVQMVNTMTKSEQEKSPGGADGSRVPIAGMVFTLDSLSNSGNPCKYWGWHWLCEVIQMSPRRTKDLEVSGKGRVM
jgi:hypothetical protein